MISISHWGLFPTNDNEPLNQHLAREWQKARDIENWKAALGLHLLEEKN